jgi:TM2 domain-containing membrane protein YozV
VSQPYQPQQPQPYGQQSYYPQPPAPYGQQSYYPQPPAPYGQPYYPMPTASPKSPGVAAILSFLIPGLGHLYSGNPLAALLWFVAAVVAWATVAIVIGFAFVPLVYLGAIIHAYVSTANFNRRHNVIR